MKEFYAIEYPGYVLNDEKALESLGGIWQLEQVRVVNVEFVL